MTAKQRVQLLLGILILAILLTVIGYSFCYFQAHRARRAIAALEIEQRRTGKLFKTHFGEAAKTTIDSIALERDLSDMTTNFMASIAEKRSEKRWLSYSGYFWVTAIGLTIGTIWIFAIVYWWASKLHTYLKDCGYEFITIYDAAFIYFSVRKLAFTLPDAATVLVLPGYGPDPDSLIRYLRDHEAYRASPRS